MARRSAANTGLAFQLARELGCRWVRFSLQTAFLRPNSPTEAPNYVIVDEMAARAAQGRFRVWLMAGQAPWPYGQAPGTNLTGWGWRTAFPGTGGYDRWGAAQPGTVGASAASQGTVSYGIGAYSGAAVDAFGSYYRFRMPESAWEAWAEVQSLAVQRFASVYAQQGGDVRDIVVEVHNEGAGPGLYDEHFVRWHNAHLAMVRFPAGVRVASDACYGHYDQATLPDEIEAHRMFWDDALARIDYSRVDVVNLHAYYHYGATHVGPPWRRYVAAFAERVAATVAYLRSRAELAGKQFALTEFGATRRTLNVQAEAARGAMLYRLIERFRRMDGLAIAMVWDANSADNAGQDVYSLVTGSGDPLGALAAVRRGMGLPAFIGGVEPLTGREYLVADTERPIAPQTAPPPY